MEHFSKQVTDARQVFIGFPKDKPDFFSLVSVGFEKCLPDFVVERDSYPEIERSNVDIECTTIEFIMAGEGKLHLSSSNYELSPGSLFSYKVGNYHRITSSPSSPMIKYFMVLAHSPSIKIESKTIKKKFNYENIRDHNEIVELFELILGNTNSPVVYGSTICNLLAHTVVLKISELAQVSSNKQVRAWDTYNRIHQHMRKNYFRIKTMDELASELHIDPAYLARVFRRFHNDSPYRFLVRLKMGHAASLLLSSSRLVKDIAFELGFENPFHFSRTFKSVYGVSPENFLQNK
ncbi:MAG: helix-turn-helix transcriptional regulator [Flavobacteriaceae bacterium]|jgi:AraC-like DNA-binding protein|nr:helix-turn-helix transcriptional regulator [Flavobacteriaceae bacterium]MBT7406378.1 helix-turn-helix transcriptional regulator [Opitutae bacterium]